MLNYLIPKKIYDYLKEFVPDLPIYTYNVNKIENEGFVFQTMQPDGLPTNFCKNIKTFKYKIYYIKNAHGNAHIKQIEDMDLIIKKLKELKKLIISPYFLNVKCIYINENPYPLESWTIAEIENYDIASQIYSITLGMEIEILERNN